MGQFLALGFQLGGSFARPFGLDLVLLFHSRELSVITRGQFGGFVLQCDDAISGSLQIRIQPLRPLVALFEFARLLAEQFEKSLAVRFDFGELPLQRLHVQFALAQHVGGLRNIDERFRLGQLAAGTERDEEMRVFRAAATAVNARLGRPEADGRMKRERFHSILQQQSNIRENAFQFPHELLGFKLVLVIRIGARRRACLGVVAFVRRRDDEQAFAA